MELLHSNLPPMKSGCPTFIDKFNALVPLCSELDIAVGYVTADSLVELQKLVELNDNLHYLMLIIGMHYWERFTKPEYMAAVALHDFLKANDIGDVRLVVPFRYHGKLYSYSDAQGPLAGIIGSNNLSSIVKGGQKVYESSLLVDDRRAAGDIKKFIQDLSRTSTKSISELEITAFKKENPVLADLDMVRRLTRYEMGIKNLKNTTYSFDIPLKPYEDAPGSNMNVFFGKGRETKRTGLVRARPWYEVEVIVPKSITSRPGYPGTQGVPTEFTVITDDGWSFECNVNGDYNKNFRSKGGLEVLGKWLKGRMEAEGALKPGDRVTRDTFARYGRSTFTLAKLADSDEWLLDFGVAK